MQLKHTVLYNSGHVCTNGTGHINNEQQAAASDASCINFGEELLEADIDIDMSEEASEPINKNMSMNDFLMGLQKLFALFILKLGKHHCIPTVVQTEVTEEVRAFINFFTSIS